jgi:hypothetical protein
MLSEKCCHNPDGTGHRKVSAVGPRAFSCRRIFVLMLIVSIAVSVAALAQDVPPPPKPADAGPSLETTMKFIQERLEAIGPVNFILYLRDNKDGSDWTNISTNKTPISGRTQRVAASITTRTKKITT